MKGFERFIFMVVQYGGQRERFFEEKKNLDGKPVLKAEVRILPDGTFLGKAMENVRSGKLPVDANQQRRLEAIGFYAPRISPEHRVNMQKELNRLNQ